MDLAGHIPVAEHIDLQAGLPVGRAAAVMLACCTYTEARDQPRLTACQLADQLDELIADAIALRSVVEQQS